METLVFSELLKQASWAEDEYRFWHFRDRSHHEVDIVIENSEGRVVGVEVKASPTQALMNSPVHLFTPEHEILRIIVSFVSLWLKPIHDASPKH